MTDRPYSDATVRQMRIWEHFQNRAPAKFRAARPRLDFLLREVRRVLRRPTPRVLNVGAGDGYFESEARRLGWEIHTLDPDPTTVARLESEGIRGHVGVMERMPIAEGRFDAVVASEVLEHLLPEQGARAITEVARVLAPGGWFIGSVPFEEDLASNQVVCPGCGEVFHRIGHQRAFSVESLRADLEGALSVERLQVRVFGAYPFRGRSLAGKGKSLVLTLLIRLGFRLGNPPCLVFVARKR